MGTCQSAPADPLIGRSVTVDKDVPNSPMRSPLRKLLRKSNNRAANKLSIIIDNSSNNRNGPMSPSEETQPETPSSLLSPSSSSSAKKKPEPKTPTTLVSMIAAADAMMSPARTETSDTHNTAATDAFDEIRQSSLMGLENIMIPEETDPDAPSDEEESYLRYVEQTHKQHGVSAWEMEPGPIFSAKSSSKRGVSPPRPQTAIKLKHKKITRPGSIQHHIATAPLVVPPPGTVFLQTPKNPQSVERSHLAAFQKLKVQAQLQQHEAKLKRRSEKFEDRYADVQEYRKLYKEFEDMQSSVEDVLKERPPMLRRSKSFDLKETDSWWYNFHSMADDDDDHWDDDSDEDSIYSHQSQYSLLSAASMESQRRFFAAKKAKTTSSKLKALDDILQGIQDRKNNPKQALQQQHKKDSNDYGPPSGTNSKRRLSISSDYGPSVTSGLSESDYGPPNNSRRPSTSSSSIIVTNERPFQGDCATTNDEQELHQGSNAATSSGLIDLSSQSNVMKFMMAQTDTNDDDAEPRSSSNDEPVPLSCKVPDDEIDLGGGQGGMLKYMMASAYLSEPRSPSPNGIDDDEAETPVITNITTGTPSKSMFVTDDNDEDEKKDDPDDRQPIWRTFEENDRTSPELYRPPNSVYTMTTQDFLRQSDNDALVVRSISRLPSDEEDDTVVRARRLDFLAS